jgi:hypothetical protein
MCVDEYNYKYINHNLLTNKQNIQKNQFVQFFNVKTIKINIIYKNHIYKNNLYY